MAAETNEHVDEHDDDNGEAIIVEESCSKGVFREQKKVSGIWMFFVVDKSDKTKAICLNCKEKVSRGGSNPKNFNKTNLRRKEAVRGKASSETKRH